MSAPTVAGIISLMLTVNKNLKPKEIRRILRETDQRDILYGPTDAAEGFIPASNDTAGMVNAYEAVKAANGGKPPTGLPTPDPGSGNFSIQSVSETRPENAPSELIFWLLRGTERLQVRPENLVAVGISNQDLSQLEVEIRNADGTRQRANIAQLSQADSYAAFQIPAEVEPGLKDVILRIGIKEVLMERALEVQPNGRVAILSDKPSVFVNGADWATFTVKLRQADGSPMPDGMPIWVSIPAYNYLGLTDVELMDGTDYNGVVYVQNGEIKLKVSSIQRVPLTAYPEDSGWPDWTKGHPNIYIKDVCIASYSSYSGYYCGERIGPESTDTQERVYLSDIFRGEVNPQGQTVYSGGNVYTMTVSFFDRAGLPIPHGTSIYSSGYSYAESIDIPPTTTQNQLTITYRSQLSPCWGADRSGYSVGDGVRLRGSYWPGAEYDVVAPYVQYALAPGCP